MSVPFKHIYKFDSFVLDVEEQVLLRDGRTVPLTPKVFETLVLLVKHQGSIVSKKKILDTLWPDVFVEESNITFNITKLRKALGDTKRPSLYIETVPRRGYRFKTAVREVPCDDPAPTISPTDNGHVENGRSAPKPVQPPVEILSENLIHPNGAVSQSHFPVAAKQRAVLFLGLALIVLIGIAGASWRLNRRQAKSIPAAATAPANLKLEQITTYGNVVTAAISPDGKQVVYVRENSGQQSLWLLQLATVVNVQLLPPKEGTVFNKVCFSHDGEYVYFVSHEEDHPTDLYRIPTLHGLPTRIAENVDAYSLSSDDRTIVFRRRNLIDQEDGLYMADLTTGQERPLVRHKAPDWIRAFSLSPDRKVIALASGESDSQRLTMNISEFNLETGQEKPLLKPNWYFIWQLEWLPDGKSILLCARETPLLNAQLWRMSYPEGTLQRVTNDLNNYLLFSLNADASKMIAVQSTLASHVWVSPNSDGTKAKNVADGRGRAVWTQDGRLVYNFASFLGSDLWISRPDGTEPKQLTVNAGVNDWPTISPDGRTIVFQSNRSGSQHLWRMGIDGSNQVQLTNGYAERNAAFSHDGKWVYYNSSADNLLWKVALDTGQLIKLSDEYAAYPSVSPDGKLIACFHFPSYAHEARITVRSTDDMRTVAELRMAPGFWISRSIQWASDSEKLIYAVETKGKVRIFEQSIDTGPPQELTSLAGEDEFEFSFAPNHKELAYVSTKWNHDTVLIAGLK
jgi:Tol biopolymer transport system component/DNA-binding winged helix-turn-helix (wHTH) protein